LPFTVSARQFTDSSLSLTSAEWAQILVDLHGSTNDSDFGGYFDGAVIFDRLSFNIGSIEIDGVVAGVNLYDEQDAVVDPDVITNSDLATALKMNTSFADWSASNEYPSNWVDHLNSSGVIQRETSSVLTGSHAVRLGATTSPQEGLAIVRESDAVDIPLTAVLRGTLIANIITHSSGGPPGIVVDLLDGSGNYYRRVVTLDTARTGRWQMIPFVLSSSDNDSSSGTPATRFEKVRIYLFASGTAGALDLWTGDVVFDSVPFTIEA